MQEEERLEEDSTNEDHMQAGAFTEEIGKEE